MTAKQQKEIIKNRAMVDTNITAGIFRNHVFATHPLVESHGGGLWDGLRDVSAQNRLRDGPAPNNVQEGAALAPATAKHHALATKNLMDIALLSWSKMLLRACFWTP